MRDPIVILCEGSDQRANLVTARPYGRGNCAMCNSVVQTYNGEALTHSRFDVMAMIERGDFDPSELLESDA